MQAFGYLLFILLCAVFVFGMFTILNMLNNPFVYRLLEDRIEIWWRGHLARTMLRSDLKSIRFPARSDLRYLFWSGVLGARYISGGAQMFSRKLVIETRTGINIIAPRDPEAFIKYFEDASRQRVSLSSVTLSTQQDM